MGCKATWTPRGSDGRTLLFESPAGQPLRGAAVNGDLCTDAVLAMIGAAFAAEGESRFVDIRNLQFKECDRVREPIDELRKIRATVLPPTNPVTAEAPRRPARKDAQPLWYEPEDDPDTIHIEGAPQGYDGGIEVDGRGDHRVIMLLSIAALRCRQGLRIRGAEHVSKSFPGWFRTLRAMGIRVLEE
jgi:3-phosphoshikimate 1-carboxyvinyltransferase